jgi:hypothetical protein
MKFSMTGQETDPLNTGLTVFDLDNFDPIIQSFYVKITQQKQK